MYQGFRLYLGKRSEMIVFESFLTNFELSAFVEAAGALAKLVRAEKNPPWAKSSLSKSLIHTVAFLSRNYYFKRDIIILLSL